MLCCLSKRLPERMARSPCEGEGLGWTGMLWLTSSPGRWQGPLLSPAGCRPSPGAWIAARWGGKQRVRNARCRAHVRYGAQQDQTFRWAFYRVIPTSSRLLQVWVLQHCGGIMVCRVAGSPALAGCREG